MIARNEQGVEREYLILRGGVAIEVFPHQRKLVERAKAMARYYNLPDLLETIDFDPHFDDATDKGDASFGIGYWVKKKDEKQ
jgi:hypothetical protein